MAEITLNPSAARKHGGKKVRSRRTSTRVDLTAMVDLGFLLITFFMLATTFNKPRTMEVNKPVKDPVETAAPSIPMSKTVTFMLAKNNRIYAYVAPDEIDPSADLHWEDLDYSPSGLRAYLQKRQSAVQQQWGDRQELFVMIKPLPESNLKNTVDILDEMTITDVRRYALLAPDDPVDSLIAMRTGERWK